MAWGIMKYLQLIYVVKKWHNLLASYHFVCMWWNYYVHKAYKREHSLRFYVPSACAKLAIVWSRLISCKLFNWYFLMPFVLWNEILCTYAYVVHSLWCTLFIKSCMVNYVFIYNTHFKSMYWLIMYIVFGKYVP